MGMGEHPIVVMQHPLASKTVSEVKKVAEAIVEGIVQGLERTKQ